MYMCTPTTKLHSRKFPLESILNSVKKSNRSVSCTGSKFNFPDSIKENTKGSFVPLQFVPTAPQSKKNSKISVEIPNRYVPPVYRVDSNRKQYLKSERRRYSAMPTPNEPQKCIALINLFPESEAKHQKKPRVNSNGLIISCRIKKTHNSLHKVKHLSNKNSSCSPMLIENYKSASQKAMNNNMDEESEYMNPPYFREDISNKKYNFEYTIKKSTAEEIDNKLQLLTIFPPHEGKLNKMYNFENNSLDDSPDRIITSALNLE